MSASSAWKDEIVLLILKTVILGEVLNFVAYAFTDAILVTPLGALSVLIGAVLGSYFLGERLGILGRVGCAICFIGSVVIVLHAPPDKELANIDELLSYALRWGTFVQYEFCGERQRVNWILTMFCWQAF